MKILHLIKAVSGRVLIIGALILSPLAQWAQDDGPGRIGRLNYRIVDVRPGQVSAYLSAIGEVSELARAAGWPLFHVFERVRGTMPAFVVLTTDNAYNDLPELELRAGLLNRLQNSQNSITVLSLAVYADLSTTTYGTVEPSGDFMRVRVRTVAPGNVDAYLDWQKNEMTPALREAGTRDSRITRVTLGGNSNSFIRFSYPNTLVGGELDVGEAIGEREFERILEREASLLVSAEDYVYRYLPDLSFTAVVGFE